MTFPSCTTLELDRDGDWLTVWLNRPAARNALSTETMTELGAVFAALHEARDVRGVTLRGRGGVFCAGGDLKGFQALFAGGDTAGIAAMNREGGKLFDVVAGIPQVLVVLVEGAAMAGGLGLVCAADVVAVTRDATFAISETSIGLVPAQIAPLLVQRLGLRVARRLMLTGERFDGTEAERIGLADYAVADVAALDALARDVRAKVRRCAPGANAATKRIVLATQRLDRAAMIELAGETFAHCLLSDEGREGIASFLAKRKPAWAVAPGARS